MLNLSDFCNECWPRTAKPWFEDGYVYASDGRIIVKVPAADYPAATTTSKVSAAEVVARFWPDKPYTLEPMPAIAANTMQKCPDCEGHGTTYVQCTDCDGTGTCMCDNCGNEHECKTCNGKGFVYSSTEQCTHCTGTGKRLLPVDQLVCDTLIACKHVQQITTLPNVQVTKGKHNSLFFEFDGGCGLVTGLITVATPNCYT